MTQATVAVQTETTSVRIAISGEIDIENAAEVERQIVDAIGNLADEVLIDLTHLLYMDSSGLRLLMLVRSMLNKQDAMLRLCGTQGRVRALLRMTKTDTLLNLGESLEERLADVQQG